MSTMARQQFEHMNLVGVSNFESKNLTKSHGQLIYHNRQQNEIAATLVAVVWRLHFIG